MNYRRKLIAVLVGAICATAATAGTVSNPRAFNSNPCGPFTIAFVNGIGTTLDGAAENLRELTAAYGNAYTGHPLDYVLAYNQTQGIPIDLYQAIMQVINSKIGATWTNVYNAVQSSIYASGMTPTIEASIASTFDNLFGLIKPAPYKTSDFDAIYNALASRWSAGRRMVVVTHSQGNLYAVDLYNKLIAGGVPSISIGFVGVANPDDNAPMVYFTSSNDFIIDSVRKATTSQGLTPPLKANITIPYNFTADKLGHSFATYLGDPNAKNQIVTAIYNKMHGLKTTIKLGTANTGTSKFFGMASWADCTVPDMSKWPWWPPVSRDSSCGFGGDPVQYFTPMVFYRVAGQTSQITAAGDASLVPGLAIKQRDACVAAAASFWSTYVATGAVSGTYSNCTTSYGGSSTKMELALRYRDLKSGDDGKTTPWSKTWTGASIGIGPIAVGGTDEYIGPTCNN